MATMDRAGQTGGGRPGFVADLFPSKHHPRPQVRELPPGPTSYGRLIGPGIIAAGVGLASKPCLTR